jgi:hypothetical protein
MQYSGFQATLRPDVDGEILQKQLAQFGPQPPQGVRTTYPDDTI